jgi:PAT family beta-lactamase induction signal transducer AmpG
MLALGFAAGLPTLLIFDTLSAWLRDDGLSLSVIGFFSLATLAASFKFLWAPLIDRTSVPVLTAWLGHRRSWMLAAQAVIVAGLWLIAGSDPSEHLGVMAALAVMIGFAAASQDIVIDAWRIEVAEDTRQETLAAAYQWGYRVAILVAGIVPLAIAQRSSWSLSYSVMAGLMLLGVVAVLAAPRERSHLVRPISTEGLPRRPVAEVAEWIARLAVITAGSIVAGAGLTGNVELLARPLVAMGGLPESADAFRAEWSARPGGTWLQIGALLVGFACIVLAAWPLPRVRTRPGLYLASALGAPIRDFVVRYGSAAKLILAMICLYRLSDFVLNIMTPFYLDLGFTLVEIASVRKVFGILMTMLGVVLAGLLMVRLGLLRALLIGAFAGPISNAAFIWLATQGSDLRALAVAIAIDNVAGGYAGTCLIAYMSSLTSAGYTATQYALFSSLYSLPGKLLASQSGRIVEGSARNAEGGGTLAVLRELFARTPPEAYATSVEKSGVAPSALGAGYVAFFLYSIAIGLASVVLTWWVFVRTRGRDVPPRVGAAASPANGSGSSAAAS